MEMLGLGTGLCLGIAIGIGAGFFGGVEQKKTELVQRLKALVEQGELVVMNRVGEHLDINELLK